MSLSDTNSSHSLQVQRPEAERIRSTAHTEIGAQHEVFKLQSKKERTKYKKDTERQKPVDTEKRRARNDQRDKVKA